MNDTPTPLDALSPLLRQVEDLRRSEGILENADAMMRLQAGAWHQGYIAAIKDFATGNTETSPNPFEATQPTGEVAPDPAPGNPVACTNTPPA